MFNLDAMKLRPSSVFTWQCYLQHVGVEYLGQTTTRYLVYLFSNGNKLLDSILSASNWCFGISGAGENYHAR